MRLKDDHHHSLYTEWCKKVLYVLCPMVVAKPPLPFCTALFPSLSWKHLGTLVISLKADCPREPLMWASTVLPWVQGSQTRLGYLELHMPVPRCMKVMHSTIAVESLWNCTNFVQLPGQKTRKATTKVDTHWRVRDAFIKTEFRQRHGKAISCCGIRLLFLQFTLKPRNWMWDRDLLVFYKTCLQNRLHSSPSSRLIAGERPNGITLNSYACSWKANQKNH